MVRETYYACILTAICDVSHASKHMQKIYQALALALGTKVKIYNIPGLYIYIIGRSFYIDPDISTYSYCARVNVFLMRI